MRSGTGFGQILDEHLARLSDAWPSAPAPERAIVDRLAPPAGFFRGALAGLGGATRAAATSVYRSAQPVPPRRPAHRSLSASQGRAIDCLRSLGACSLDEAFTEAELKSAFRSLARDLHPDRHQHASEHERQFLSRRFARACDAYRELCRVFVH